MQNRSLLIDKYIIAQKINILLSLRQSVPPKPSLTIGFPPPYHSIFSSHSLTFSLSHNPSFHADTAALPFHDASISTVFLYTHNPYPHHKIREIWRILDDAGFLIFITSSHKNRWLLSSHDPLRKESGYSLTSLSQLLHDQLFSIISLSRSLRTPTLIRHLSFPHPQFPLFAERTAEILTPALGGLITALAQKNITVPILKTSPHTKTQLSHAS